LVSPQNVFGLVLEGFIFEENPPIAPALEFVPLADGIILSRDNVHVVHVAIRNSSFDQE
jgi:hypothetical protein